MLGTNHDDAVKMLEKYSESAGKCDNNRRKWSKNYPKMKETGKTLGNMKMEEIVQKPMEERSENGRKHVIKKRWTEHIENTGRGCIGKFNETAGRHDNDQRKSCKIYWKMLENTVKVQENVITTRGNGAKTIGK